MNDRVFHGNINRLRSPERVALLEVDRVVAAALDGTNARSMLDVGCGTALFSEAFAKRGLEVSGIDANPEMVAAAQTYVPQGHFQVASAEHIPFPDAHFDLVFFGVVLHETDDAAQALKEAFRVARWGAAVLEWPYNHAQSFGPPPEHRLKLEQVQEMAQKAGFQSFESIPFDNVILYRLKKEPGP